LTFSINRVTLPLYFKAYKTSAAGTPAPAPVSFTDGIAEYLKQERSSIQVTLADGLENLFGESSNAYELCIIFPQKPSSSAKECNLTKKSGLAKSYLKLFEQARLREAFSIISACTLTCFNFLNCAIVIARVPKNESTQGFDRSQYLSASQVRVSQDLLSKSVVFEKDPSSKVQSISIGKIEQDCDIQSECFGIKLILQQRAQILPIRKVMTTIGLQRKVMIWQQQHLQQIQTLHYQAMSAQLQRLLLLLHPLMLLINIQFQSLLRVHLMIQEI
jgi:hypothetical protein